MYSLIDGEKEGGEQLSLGLLRRISRSTRGQSSKLDCSSSSPLKVIQKILVGHRIVQEKSVMAPALVSSSESTYNLMHGACPDVHDG